MTSSFCLGSGLFCHDGKGKSEAVVCEGEQNKAGHPRLAFLDLPPATRFLEDFDLATSWSSPAPTSGPVPSQQSSDAITDQFTVVPDGRTGPGRSTQAAPSTNVDASEPVLSQQSSDLTTDPSAGVPSGRSGSGCSTLAASSSHKSNVDRDLSPRTADQGTNGTAESISGRLSSSSAGPASSAHTRSRVDFAGPSGRDADLGHQTSPSPMKTPVAPCMPQSGSTSKSLIFVAILVLLLKLKSKPKLKSK